ncbi:ER membrane protein complex subunit 6, partial [Mucuna pruriens]
KFNLDTISVPVMNVQVGMGYDSGGGGNSDDDTSSGDDESDGGNQWYGMVVVVVVLVLIIMAVHSDSASSEKKSSTELLTFNAENMQSNMKTIYYSRTFLSIIGGVVAGILGFTGLKGFVFYLLLMALTSLGLVAKARFSTHSYFDSWNRVLLDGFLSGLMVVVRAVLDVSFSLIILWWCSMNLPMTLFIYSDGRNVQMFQEKAILASAAAIDPCPNAATSSVSQVGRRKNVVLYLWLSEFGL